MRSQGRHHGLGSVAAMAGPTTVAGRALRRETTLTAPIPTPTTRSKATRPQRGASATNPPPSRGTSPTAATRTAAGLSCTLRLRTEAGLWEPTGTEAGPSCRPRRARLGTEIRGQARLGTGGTRGARLRTGDDRRARLGNTSQARLGTGQARLRTGMGQARLGTAIRGRARLGTLGASGRARLGNTFQARLRTGMGQARLGTNGRARLGAAMRGWRLGIRARLSRRGRSRACEPGLFLFLILILFVPEAGLLPGWVQR